MIISKFHKIVAIAALLCVIPVQNTLPNRQISPSGSESYSTQSLLIGAATLGIAVAGAAYLWNWYNRVSKKVQKFRQMSKQVEDKIKKAIVSSLRIFRYTDKEAEEKAEEIVSKVKKIVNNAADENYDNMEKDITEAIKLSFPRMANLSSKIPEKIAKIIVKKLKSED